MDFVKRIYLKMYVPSNSSQNQPGHESSRLALDATSINKKKLLKAGIYLKYIDVLKNFSWVN